MLVRRIERLEAENSALIAENAALKAENADLKERLGMNSSNSSKPPSSDPPNKPSHPDKPTRGAKQRGPKDGHPGNTRSSFESPDVAVDLRAEICPDCATPLDGKGTLTGTRTVAEMVEKPVIVTEYRSWLRVCPCCGKRVEAPEPQGLLPGFSLGPRLIGFLGMLDHYGNVTSEKLATLMDEAFNLPICEGTLDNANQWLNASLAAPVAELQEILPTLPHAHIDETGWSIDGERHWLWVFSTQELTFTVIRKSRGAKVLLEMLSAAFPGLISCDFWIAYRSKDGVAGTRTFCWAHLAREAQALIDGYNSTAQKMGRELRRLLRKGWLHYRGLMRGRIDVVAFQRLGDRLKQRILELLATYDVPLPPKAKALRKRLLTHIGGYFEWYLHPGVPPDNNPGEQAIRPAVVNRKISGGNRSQWGAELTARMQTVLGTCRKQGREILDTLSAYLLALAHPGLSYPSLVPLIHSTS